MGCGTGFVKYVLFFFNLLVALLGLAVIGIGAAFLLNLAVVKNELDGKLTVAPWLFIVLGSVMFIIAFFGCCGAIRESHCMVVTYAIFLLVIIIVQVVVAVLLFTHGETIKEGIDKSIYGLFQKRSSSDVDKATEGIIDSIQEQFQCCGGRGAEDYGVVLTLPNSCCSRDGSIISSALGGKCTIATAHRDGCAPKLTSLYEKWSKPIAYVAIGVACVEIVGALFALCLANSIRNMDRRSRY